MSDSKLHVFTTGGTIDKVYFDALSEFQVGETALDHILKEANFSAPYEITSLMRKDSLELTDEDRAILREAIAASKSDNILVTHGTDTMVKSANALGDMPNTTIVFTGAMQPASLRSTDAVFNIGFALACTQIMPPGIYIAMSGRVFKATNVRKDRDAQRFVEISDTNT